MTYHFEGFARPVPYLSGTALSAVSPSWSEMCQGTGRGRHRLHRLQRWTHFQPHPLLQTWRLGLLLRLWPGLSLSVKQQYKDCLIIIRTLILLPLFAVNFHAFNAEAGEV